MLAVTNHTFPREAEDALAKFGHRTLRLPPHPILPSPVSSHPDMLLFFAPDRIFCTKSYYKIAEQELKKITLAYDAPIHFIDAEYGNEYPYDVLLNALPMGKHLFCNTKTVAQELLKIGFTSCHVNQGYTKCSALPLRGDALITSDASIAQRATEAGIDALKIQAGHISLSGYDYGFIGGCASFAPRENSDTVFFCGDVSQHPDYNQMNNFFQSKCLDIANLSNFGLCDVGTIFLI